MNIYTPYTYTVRHRPTGMRYYGSRYCNSKARGIATPADLWTKYFTSSKKIKALIDSDGLDAFDVEIRRTFDTAAEALAWEKKVLRRLKVTERFDWLNDCVGEGLSDINETIKRKIARSQSGKRASIETKAKMSAKRIGIKRKPFTEIHRVNMSKSQKGKSRDPRTEETKAKISASNKGRNCKTFRFILPDGMIHMVDNLPAFAAEHDLSLNSLRDVTCGRRKVYQGISLGS